MPNHRQFATYKVQEWSSAWIKSSRCLQTSLIGSVILVSYDSRFDDAAARASARSAAGGVTRSPEAVGCGA
jgi:hypothetical protein